MNPYMRIKQFTTDLVMSNGGVVYGCVLIENFIDTNIRAESIEDAIKCWDLSTFRVVLVILLRM